MEVIFPLNFRLRRFVVEYVQSNWNLILSELARWKEVYSCGERLSWSGG